MPFPTVTLLDSFIRAEENPLSNGGKWKDFFESAEHKGRCNGTEWETISGSTKEGAYWQPETFKEPGVALDLTFKNPVREGNYWSLLACLGEPESAIFTGYRLKIVAAEAGEGSFTFILEKAVAGVWTVMTEKAAVTMKAGYRFGLSVQGGKVIGWRKIAAGAWEEILNHADVSYTEGFIGFNAIAQDGDVINFEGGPESSGPPVLENPGTRHNVINKPLSLQIHSTHTTEYKAEGLPEGLTINEATGLITGEPKKLGSSKVKIKVKGPEGEAETEFEWIIEEKSAVKKNKTYVIV